MALDTLREQYVELFGADGLAGDGIAPSDAAEPALIVCFTNRSGSNYVCELLRSTGQLGWAPEALNAGFISKQIEMWEAAGEIDTLAKYVRRLRLDLTGRGQRPPVVKLGWQQLFFLAEAGILDDVFPNRRLLLVRRRNLLAQSVSYALAAKSGEWRSDRVGNAEVVEVADHEVSTDDIIGRVRSVLLADRHLRSFAAVSGDPLFELVYEDVDINPQAAVDDVLAFMDLPATAIDPDAVRVSRQSSPRNAALAQAVVDEVRTHWDGAVAEPQRARWDSFLASYPMADINDRVAEVWPASAWRPSTESAVDGLILIVSPLIEDAHDVGRWLSSHPSVAGPSSPVFPAEIEDAHPGGLAAHLVRGARRDGEAWRVQVVRPYEFCYLVESGLIPTVLGMPHVLFVRHADLLGAGRALSDAMNLEGPLEGLRAIAEAEQQVREVAACFDVPLEEIRTGGTVHQAHLRRATIARGLGIDDDLLFAPTPMMGHFPTAEQRPAREAAITVWPRIVDHETGAVTGYGGAIATPDGHTSTID